MRELGATRVRCGHLEVAFAAPPEAPEPPEKPGRMERISASTTELEELQELRAMKQRADELGMEL
jgi:hypothetical protein